MAETSIEWADYTFNPWEGCQKVGPGCDHCYAEARNARYVRKDDPAYGTGAAPNWGPGAPRRRTSAANWRKPHHWNAAAIASGKRARVFCASLADVFDNAVDPLMRTDLADLVEATPALDWLFLTKRIGNAKHMMQAHMGWATPPANVWIGATVVNQTEADRDIPKLLATPARVRFLSMEPLLGPADLKAWLQPRWPECFCAVGPSEAETAVDRNLVERCPHCNRALGGDPVCPLDWIIVGGESGPGARPMRPEWARSLRDQCAAAGAAFLFKQWGEWDADALLYTDVRTGECPPKRMKIGKKASGRLLDGVTHDGFPTPALSSFAQVSHA